MKSETTTSTLKELFSDIPYRTAQAVSDSGIIRGICLDTRQLKDENLFVVMPGEKFSSSVIMNELARTPVEYVVMDSLEAGKIEPGLFDHKQILFVENIQQTAVTLADRFFGYPQKELSLVGITGTNGKTTTAYMIFQALNALGIKASCLGTVRYWIDAETSEASPLTTPDFLTLRKLLRSSVDRGVKTVVMEASSHALSQGRVKGFPFSYAVFTNLSQDHLDYHKTLASYFGAKSKLFTDYLKHDGVSLINIDDERGSVLFHIIGGKKISFGIEQPASYQAKDIRYSDGKTACRIVTPSESAVFEFGFFGPHNVYNTLGAVAVLEQMGIPLAQVQEAFKTVKLPPGRMEKVAENVFVDYAHTPDALKNSLCSLKASGYGTIIVVFGCGGDRDKKKRPMMGTVASDLAHHSIITTDNPRSEDPETICQEIIKGFEKNSYTVILDRKEALAEGIRMLQRTPTAALLVAGKGHEDYQALSAGKIHFSDQEEIARLLNLPLHG